MPERTSPEVHIHRDAMHRACILVAVLTGAVERADAVRAVGYLPGGLEEDITDCAEAGARLVQAALEGRFQWQVLWRLHAEEAKALARKPARPDRRIIHPAHPAPPRRAPDMPSAARLKPLADRRPPTV